MIDWEDVWDIAGTILKIILFLSMIGIVTILGVNQCLNYDKMYPTHQAVYNGTNYTCTADASVDRTFDWNFSVDWSEWWQYLIVYLLLFFAFLIVGLFIFGYIPICGCGRI